MEKQNIRQRIAELRKKMIAEGVDFYLVPTGDYHNSEYVSPYFKMREFLSGFTGSNGTLAVSADWAGLWTDGRYFIQAEKELKGTGITLYRMQEEGVPGLCEYLKRQLKKGQVLGFDGRVVDSALGIKLEKAAAGKGAVLSWNQDLAADIWTDRPPLPCEKVWTVPPKLSGKDVEEKLADTRARMEAEGARFLFIGGLDDVMWLFNLRGGDIPCNPVALSYGLVTMTEAYLFLQKEALSAEVREALEASGVTLESYHGIADFLEKFSFQAEDGGREGKLMFDARHTGYALYCILRGRGNCVDVMSPVEAMKAVKNPVELSGMREVYLRDSVAVTRFIYWLKTQIGKEELTEYSAGRYLDSLRRETEGFLDVSFPTISAYREHAAMMHYEASETQSSRLEEDGALLVDSGGQYLGGTTDVTRTIVLGPVSAEFRKHFTAVAAGMLELSFAVFLYGCTGRSLDILARKPLWDMRIDYKCGTGHGVGCMLNVHEGPQSLRWRYVKGAEEAVLEEGMVLTNEPGVYLEGRYGIRTENVMAVRKAEKNGDGQFMRFETLTFVPIDREAIDASLLSPAQLEKLNLYHRLVYEKIAPQLPEKERLWLRQATAEIL